MLIQGDRLLSELAKGDEVAVQRLLTEMPSLANYESKVFATKGRFGTKKSRMPKANSVRIIDSSLHDETYRHHIFT